MKRSKKSSRPAGKTALDCSDDPFDKAIEMLKRHDFSEEEARTILRSVYAATPERLMDAANRIVTYCCKISAAWQLVTCVSLGYVEVGFDERGMVCRLTEKGKTAGGQLLTDGCLPEIPQP